MRIICQKDLLVEAVSNTARATCAKSPVPALEGILLKAEEGKLHLTGYDLELGIVTSIEAKTEQQGELVLSAKLLLDIIRRIPGETVSIDSDEKYLATIRGGASEFTIPGLSAEEFPELPNVETQADLVLKQGVLKSMIDQTLFAVATTDSKPVHTGSLFDIKDSCVTLVSVDGYRLALRREPIVSDLATRFIVPGKTLSEISKLLREEEEEKCHVVDEEEIEGTEKLSKGKVVSLVLILLTVFLWFMGYNAVKSHLSTYATQTLAFEQGFVGTITLLNGLGGAIALLPVALLANKLGRKKTIIIGVVLAAVAFFPCFFMTATTPGVKVLFPMCFILAGFGMVCVNVNTLPMVVELSKGSTVGRYTGYYYAFSMSAQAVTPAFAGVFMNISSQSVVFIYASIFIVLSLMTTIFIKHGDNRPPKKKKFLEYFSDED